MRDGRVNNALNIHIVILMKRGLIVSKFKNTLSKPIDEFDDNTKIAKCKQSDVDRYITVQFSVISSASFNQRTLIVHLDTYYL